jgi:hypothetical protein
MRHDLAVNGHTLRLCLAGSLAEQFDVLYRFRNAMLWSLPSVMIFGS